MSASRISGLLRRARTLRDSGKFMSHEFAQEFEGFYKNLEDKQERKAVLQTLGTEFGVNVTALREASQLFLRSDGDGAAPADARLLQNHVHQFERALQPAHASLLSTLSQLPDGMEFILRLRRDTVGMLKDDAGNVGLRALDDSLKTQLQAWFALGFLQLRQVTWDATPANILEKVIKYEAVHSISDWGALKQRLVGPKRCCFAFFHPSLPSEPLVFVEVALIQEIADSIQTILEEPTGKTSEEAPTTAVFYSITSTQPGLAGVDLGNYLIKDVVKTLKAQHPSLNTFVTLSPLPGFGKWVNTQLAQKSEGFLTPSEAQTLQQALPTKLASSSSSSLLQSALATSAQWPQDRQLAGVLRPIVMRLGAKYLYQEKHRKLALDPVANFHIRNGAWLWRLNWLADTSAKGLAQSYGLMVNYRYVLEDIGKNNQLYLENGTIAVTDSVKALL